MGMQHKAKNIVLIITACAALHNFACLLREPEPPAQRVPQPSPNSSVSTRTVHLPPVDRLTDSRSGNQARELLIRKSFT
uniref:Secreted peptide n=1 Tax=Rhipicephalus pulchellus TaxID=72859 RepID=L7LXE6_RHIPC